MKVLSDKHFKSVSRPNKTVIESLALGPSALRDILLGEEGAFSRLLLGSLSKARSWAAVIGESWALAQESAASESPVRRAVMVTKSTPESRFVE